MVRYPIVGRTVEDPEVERFYWLAGAIGPYVVVNPSDDDTRRMHGLPADFRRYGEALADEVNPHLRKLPIEKRHRVRNRLVAELDRRWRVRG